MTQRPSEITPTFIVQMATVHASPDPVFLQERKMRSDYCILIASEDVKETDQQQKRENTIASIKEFYAKVTVPVEVILLQSTKLRENIVEIGKKMTSFQPGTKFILNASMGRRSLPVSMILAATFVRLFRKYNFEIVINPENTKEMLTCPLPPQQMPDEKDLGILLHLQQGRSLSEIGKKLKMAQPTVSVRVKKLVEEGFVDQDGRKFTPSIISNFILQMANLTLK